MKGFQLMLDHIEGIELIASFTDAETALTFIEKERVDIVLLDINLSGMNGIEACLQILKEQPSISVIGISNINEPAVIRRMIDAGASGYLLKDSTPEAIIACIQQVLEGKPGLSKGVQSILHSKVQPASLPLITRREREVLALLANGLSSQDIAAKIFTSPLTVESHRRTLLRKFGVVNVAALIYKAAEGKYI